MPAVFEKLGIRFLYPDNWILDEQDAIEDDRSVTVYSPGGAFWSITLSEANADPVELAAMALATLQAEYPEAESAEVSEQIGGLDVFGYDVNFFCFELTNTALIRAFRIPTASCLVLCQAEDREFEQLGAVFRAITTSLLSKVAAG